MTHNWTCILWNLVYFISVQFSHSVVSDSLRPHEPQHARLPCPSPTPRVHSDSRPLSQWCHPSISSSVVPFSSCPQSLPASESFPMSQLLFRNTFKPITKYFIINSMFDMPVYSVLYEALIFNIIIPYYRHSTNSKY